MDFSDQIALGARLAERAARGRRGRAREVQGRPARRVPGHLGRPGADAHAGCSPAPTPTHGLRPPGHRGRRPQPGDLRLARRVGVQHPRASPTTFPRRGRRASPTYPLTRQPPLRRAHPRGRQPPRRPLYADSRPGCCRWSRSPTRRPGEVTARPSTRRTTRSSPGCADRVVEPTRAMARSRRGARSASSPATTRTPPTSSTP